MRAVDLFAGWGGLTLGSSQAGTPVVWAADHHPLAGATHQLNHPGTVHACQDLRQADWAAGVRHARGQRTGSTFAGCPLPQFAYPTAVMGEDGAVVRLTNDPVPDETALTEALAEVHAVLKGGRSLRDFVEGIGTDDLVAIDISGSHDDPALEMFAVSMRVRGVDVLLVNSTVTPFTGEPLRSYGPFNLPLLIEHVQARATHPQRVWVLTDGMCTPAVPDCPDAGTWVVPVGGVDWMTAAGAGNVRYRHAW